MRFQHLQQLIPGIERVQGRPYWILGIRREQWNAFFLRQVNYKELHKAQLISSRQDSYGWK